MRNLTQSTYDRICRKLRDNGDRYPRSLTSTDASDLLLAYEGAVELLEDFVTVHDGRVGGPPQVVDFLYLKNGEPRVELEDESDDDSEIVG